VTRTDRDSRGQQGGRDKVHTSEACRVEVATPDKGNVIKGGTERYRDKITCGTQGSDNIFGEEILADRHVHGQCPRTDMSTDNVPGQMS
jgi:hypothetical protein